VLLRALILCLIIAGIGALALPAGSADISAAEVWATLFDPGAATQNQQLVVWGLRLPRLLAAIMVGAMLGVAGAAMQSVTRNGLADPGLIGVKEGAAIVILGMVIFAPTLPVVWRPIGGMAGAGVIAAIVIATSRSLSSARFVLIGIGVSFCLSGCISLFLIYSDMSQVQLAMVWLSGSLHAASWQGFYAALPWAVLGIAAIGLSSRAADAALLGDGAAVGLGVRLRGLQALRLIAPLLLTGASVSVAGSLGFVGLIAPHIARLALGSGQIPLTLGSGLFGALLVLAADSIGRTAFAPVQIPAGILMALLGVPFFLFLLWRRRHQL
jgi:iron complex transport system permease protein